MNNQLTITMYALRCGETFQITSSMYLWIGYAETMSKIELLGVQMCVLEYERNTFRGNHKTFYFYFTSLPAHIRSCLIMHLEGGSDPLGVPTKLHSSIVRVAVVLTGR